MVVDTKMKNTPMQDTMLAALNVLSQEVSRLSEGALGVLSEVVYHPYDENAIQWQSGTYNGSSHYYPTAGWVQQMNNQYDEDNVAVQLVIHPDNWKPPLAIIGGINYFQTQVIHPMSYWSLASWKITIEHELMHHFDNRAAEFPGVNFNTAVGQNRQGKTITNWDADVVHEAYPGGGHINIFDYVWDRAVDEIATIYPYTGEEDDMAKPLIKFTDENHVYLEVEVGKLVHIESPEALAAYQARGIAVTDITELPPQSRGQYKKVGVLVEFPPTDL